tara:strand:- start:801 stop:950 length:150 start_codon:yes stop_codon:yes gene_type:complete
MKTIKVGTVDIVEEQVCIVQLADETYVEFEGDLCSDLREGDVLIVERKK